MAEQVLRIHATCVAIGSGGVLVRGRSGAGKSDLALRLIDEGGELVADDQVEITRKGGNLYAAPPKILAGMIEARGIGLLQIGHKSRVKLALVVDLMPSAQIDRMPEDETVTFLGVPLPRIALSAREASATAKLRLAMRAVTGAIMKPR